MYRALQIHIFLYFSFLLSPKEALHYNIYREKSNHRKKLTKAVAESSVTEVDYNMIKQRFQPAFTWSK